MGNETSQQIKYGDKLDNNVTVTWNKLASDCPFAPRDGHVSCGFGNQLFVFGGVAKVGELETEELNDLLLLDLETKAWSLVDVKGEVPPVRVGATMQQINGKLYLFGGLSHTSGWFQDLHVFDIASRTWSKVTATGTPPGARDKLSSAVIGTKMYIFGGFGPQGGPAHEEDDEDEDYTDDDDDDDDLPDQEAAQFGWFNDMHILDTETRKWETDLNVVGKQPEPRSFHTVTAVGPRVVVIGGRGINNQHFNDLHVFDTISRQWLQPSIKGDPLVARGVHTATVVGDQCVVYGGTSEYSEEIMQCQKYHPDVYMFNTGELLLGGAKDLEAENKENAFSPNIPENLSEKGGKHAEKQPLGDPANSTAMEQH